ncbi:hypothetical protein B0H16DRAFT_1427548 [Mycena metata]|uniref:MYND-type domain-containing protein n=1 Tax=Mycena metata TaxID=1033252 RepID=A0AAD7MUH9_9AGAR|nr:hypothetical protein B0H16DRAFT_1427548 [Mycena metata]
MAFNPSCEHCIAERVQAALNAEAPPAPCHRHAESDPKQTIRKELTQCQYCYKSKGSGVTLRSCAACEVDMYCSKACQKAAWKVHKTKCALNRKTNALPAQRMDALKALRTFTSKHRPTIAEGGLRALNVFADPARAERDILLIAVRPRADSIRPETAYFVTMLSVIPIESFATNKSHEMEMRGQLKQASDDQKRRGFAGAIFVVLFDTDGVMSNIAAVGFEKNVPGGLPPLIGATWEEWVTKRLNEGIVV